MNFGFTEEQELLRGEVDHRLSRMPSSVAVGDGVFVERAAVRPGTAVAFFPGLCHCVPPPEAALDLPMAVVGETDWWQNDKVINRSDGGKVDGLAWETRHEDDGPLHGLEHPLALGHMANHPPAEAHPNVLAWGHDFDLRLLAGLGVRREAVPFANHPMWYYSGATHSVVEVPESLPLAGMVLFATRQVEVGDELYLDYNLSRALAVSLPWYSPRDPSADAAAESLAGV